jgi:hypothetical protein
MTALMTEKKSAGREKQWDWFWKKLLSWRQLVTKLYQPMTAVSTWHFSGFAVNTVAETQYSEHDSNWIWGFQYTQEINGKTHSESPNIKKASLVQNAGNKTVLLCYFGIKNKLSIMHLLCQNSHPSILERLWQHIHKKLQILSTVTSLLIHITNHVTKITKTP